MAPYFITRYETRYQEAVAEFQKLLWKASIPQNAAYLRWKYFQNPYLDHRYIALAWADNRLIGMAGASGAYWEADDGHRLMLPVLSDTLVATEYQGTPLFRQIVEDLISRLRRDRIPWLLDFGDQGALPAMIMQGWKALGPWPVATMRRNPPPQRELSDSMEFRGSRSGLLITRHPEGSSPSSWPAMVKLTARLPRRGIRHVRDFQYLAWRYRNPLARYFYFSSGFPELQGYLIAHRKLGDPDEGPTPTTIIECESANDDLWLDLIELSCRCLPGLELLMWGRDIVDRRLTQLERIGFVMDCPTGRPTRDWHLPNLMVRPTGIAAESNSFAHIDTDRWQLAGVCGRCWR